jgi:hypothetical protein
MLDLRSWQTLNRKYVLLIGKRVQWATAKDKTLIGDEKV